MPEADAPTLGPDPGSTSVSTPPTSGPLPGDQGRGDATDTGSNYERAVKLLGDVDAADPIDVSLWRETAAVLGKPAPPSPKKSASKSAGTR